MPSIKFNPSQQKVMLQIVKDSIARKLDLTFETQAIESSKNSSFKWLETPAATFVTLSINGKLRGCIGSLQAHRSLFEDLKSNAVNSAFHDSRFPPLRASEFELLSVHISVLSSPTALKTMSENELLKGLRPNIDGLILEEGAYKATFLPQVWEQLPNPRLFLEHLKQKAGLPKDYWSDQIRFYTYQVIDVYDHDDDKNFRH